MTQFGMEQLENKITTYIEKCKQIARGRGDELAEYKAQVLQLMSDCNYWRDIYIDYYGRYVNDELLEKTERFGFKNILAYIYIFIVLQVVRKNYSRLQSIRRNCFILTEV